MVTALTTAVTAVSSGDSRNVKNRDSHTDPSAAAANKWPKRGMFWGKKWHHI